MSFQDDILSTHNEKRKKHGAPPLKWSDTLERKATKWAQHLAKIDQLKHEQNVEEGENIAMAGGKDLTGEGATTMWYDEIKDYNFNKQGGFNSKTGHFTQIVWVASKQIGAGIAKSKSGRTYVVAKYLPAGNMMGNFPANVKPLGSALSKDQNANGSPMTIADPKPTQKKRTTTSTPNRQTTTQGRPAIPLLAIMSFIAGLASFALYLAALVGTHWEKGDASNHLGLWKWCDINECIAIQDVPHALRATQSLSILAAVAVFLALVLTVGKMVSPKIRYLVPASVFVMGGLFGIVSAAVYTAEVSDSSLDYGWSYALAWVGVSFAVLASILMIASR
eukprot:TCONS_00022143-protein